MTDTNPSEADLYDEFGNYIGPELSSSSDDDSDASSKSSAPSSLENDDDDEDQQQQQQQALTTTTTNNDNNNLSATTDATGTALSAIVLHEDKVHYPSAAEVYGPEITTTVLDEDAMELETPIVAPVKTKSVSLRRDDERADTSTSHKPATTSHPTATTSTTAEEDTTDLIISRSYLTNNLFFSPHSPPLRRGLALIGSHHTGKTTLTDLLIEKTKIDSDAFSPSSSLDTHDGGGPRLTDTLISERDRQTSVKSTPVTLALPDSRGKSHLLTVVDCPGHVQFHDESAVALRCVDGAMVVLDAVEGMRMHTEMLVRCCVAEGLKMVLCVNKIDRLILELRLSPSDAYFKILNVVEQMNEFLSRCDPTGRYESFDPARGNVCFGSGRHGWMVTLGDVAQLYADYYEDVGMSVEDFQRRLWGDWYLDEETRRFGRRGKKRTFVEFVLEPIYKLYVQCLGETEKDVEKTLRDIGVLLNGSELRSSVRPLIRTVMKRFFGVGSCGVVDMLLKFIPSPIKAAPVKVRRCYTGTPTPTLSQCSPTGRLLLHIVKLYATPDGQSFSAFGRIYSGTLRKNQRVKVLGENYSPYDDDEDMTLCTVKGIAIPRGRERWDVDEAPAGNWVLVDGIDHAVSKTATVTNVKDDMMAGNVDDEELNKQHEQEEDNVCIFSPLTFPQAGYESVVKLAVEPLNPAELPKMVEGLRRISKSYPMSQTRVEESGEHVLFGTGELYLDCIMHDLRHTYSDIEVKVADPIVAFRETVVETSCVKCFAETPNKRNKLTVIAEPLDDGLAEILEAGKIDLNWGNKKISRFFQSQYNYDLLSSRSIWALGSSPTHGPNLLLNDTLPSETDTSRLLSAKPSIIQGFQWATREGPLCEEPIRSSKVKILDAILADKPIHRGGGQIIPTARRTVHSAMLTATPRLMEPILRLEMTCPGDDVAKAIRPIVAKRRGHIVSTHPLAGSPLLSVTAFLPAIDSFGFETDVRTYTQGQAMVHSIFDHWAIVPGDPMDNSIILHPLEPSPVNALAREFLIKTRRRKGLSEDVSVYQFLDEGVRKLVMEMKDGDMEE